MKEIGKITVVLPIRTESEANLKEHWAVKANRTKIHRYTAGMLLFKYQHLRKQKHLTVTLTRIAPRKLDSDNLARSFKAVRDGIADALVVDDGSDKFDWRYAQEKGKPKEYSVRVEITTA